MLRKEHKSLQLWVNEQTSYLIKILFRMCFFLLLLFKIENSHIGRNIYFRWLEILCKAFEGKEPLNNH